MSTLATPPIPADVQHFPAIPSYVVALSVVAAVVVSALVIFILYTCLVQRYKMRVLSNVQESPNREIEKLREEPAEEHDDHLSDSVTEVTERHEKPKPSPSIFSRGDFLMEVLEGVENTTDLSIDGNVENTSHICEADRVTVAMDDLAQDDSHSAAPIPPSPPRQSASMDLFLADLSLTHSGSLGGGLRVRERGQADASTAQLSISSEEGGELIICRDIEIYEDSVVCEVHEDPVVSQIHEDFVVADIYEDPEVSEIHEDSVNLVVKDVELGVECLEDEIDDLVNVDIKVNNSSDKNEFAATLFEDVLTLAVGFRETIPEVDIEDGQVEDVENCPARKSVNREEELFPIEVDNIELVKGIEKDEGHEYSSTSEVPSPNTLSSVQDESSRNTPLQATPCLPELVLTPPAATIPLNIIPVSNHKHPTIPNTLSAQLSHSTPTSSLLHPLVSMHALPLADRALSVSHLSLNRSGKHLPATPLSCNSEYSPVYNMQFGSSRRLTKATEESTMKADSKEEEVDELSPGDASEVNQDKLQ